MGHLAVLQWAQHSGAVWDESICEHAAMGEGNLHTLQWLRQNACPWNGNTCKWAAARGDLAMIEWAHKNRCPWAEETWEAAAYNGQTPLLKWCCEHSSECDKIKCIQIEVIAHLDMLCWYQQNGQPRDNHFAAKAKAHLKILRWLHERTSACMVEEVQTNPLQEGLR
jgi:hypothetical protein